MSCRDAVKASFCASAKSRRWFGPAALIVLAYLSRQVDFVLNAAFSLRGLTSGALLGGLALAVFWKKGAPLPVVAGMLVSLTVMTAIQLLPKLDSTKGLWMKTVGTEIFWPWYTLIGATIGLGLGGGGWMAGTRGGGERGGGVFYSFFFVIF